MTDRPHRRPAGTWTTEEIRQTVVQAYTVDRLSIRGIADMIGAAYTTVHAILTDARVLLRPRGAQPSPRKAKHIESPAGASRRGVLR